MWPNQDPDIFRNLNINLNVIAVIHITLHLATRTNAESSTVNMDRCMVKERIAYLSLNPPAKTLSSTSSSTPSSSRGRSSTATATAGFTISTGLLHWHDDPINDNV